MDEAKLTVDQLQKALSLKEGEVLAAYWDHHALRMETEEGEDPYVWRDNQWRRMQR